METYSFFVYFIFNLFKNDTLVDSISSTKGVKYIIVELIDYYKENIELSNFVILYNKDFNNKVISRR